MFPRSLRYWARIVSPRSTVTDVAAFPPAALPAFIGTIQPSASRCRICLTPLVKIVWHTHLP
jgi:hypothetical protein